MNNRDGKFVVAQEVYEYDHAGRFSTFKEAEAYARKCTHKNSDSYAIFAMIAKSKLPSSITSIEMEKVEVAKV